MLVHSQVVITLLFLVVSHVSEVAMVFVQTENNEKILIFPTGICTVSQTRKKIKVTSLQLNVLQENI